MFSHDILIPYIYVIAIGYIQKKSNQPYLGMYILPNIRVPTTLVEEQNGQFSKKCAS